MIKSLLFWQPRQNYFARLTKTVFGTRFLLAINYSIWLFLAVISFLLIQKQPSLFGQLFIATFLAETIERLSKTFFFWSRPIGKQQQTLPAGLVKSWYNTGSFPSGHTSKVTFFFLFLLRYPVFPPFIYCLISLPLVLFRVIVGFHYPIDIIGGLLVGLVVYSLASFFTTPQFLTQFIELILSYL